MVKVLETIVIFIACAFAAVVGVWSIAVMVIGLGSQKHVPERPRPVDSYRDLDRAEPANGIRQLRIKRHGDITT